MHIGVVSKNNQIRKNPTKTNQIEKVSRYRTDNATSQIQPIIRETQPNHRNAKVSRYCNNNAISETTNNHRKPNVSRHLYWITQPLKFKRKS